MSRGATNAQLKLQWEFLDPWLEILGRRIKYKPVAFEEEVWDAEKRVLEVTLPAKNSDNYERYSQSEFNYDLREVREALALVAAVAHVDQEAWKFVLNKVWGLKLGKIGSEELEREIPARFVLIFDHLAGVVPITSYTDSENSFLKDLVHFCGTNQVEDPSPEFQTALRQLAVRAGTRLLPRDKSGLDIKIPVQVFLTDKGFLVGRQLLLKANAEKIVREQWEEYERSSRQQPLPSGKIRCTLELLPMVAEWTDSMGYSSFAPKIQKIMKDNVWFSQLSLSAESGGGLIGDACRGRDDFRQIMATVFDSTRRSPSRSTSRYYFDRGAYLRDGSPLQVNQVDFKSYTSLRSGDLGAIMSALVINQTTKKVTMRAVKRTISGDDNWMWLAYGLFSKRARAYSALETFSLNQIDSLSVSNAKALSDVIFSDHPEEVVCGTSPGVVEDRNATLNSGASIRWIFADGQPVVDAKAITTESAVRGVRTFSDDGESEWVDAIVPGMGRCQVLRDDLVFDLASAIPTHTGALKSLTIGFNKEEDTDPISDGLPDFLAAVGSTLKDLTLDGPRDDFDENLILRHCPSLHTLSLCGGIVDVQLDFSEHRYNNEPIPELKCHWHDIQALAADLSDPTNPLSKCVRRLRFRLNDQCDGWSRVEGGYDFDKIPDDMKAVTRMLTVNRHLVYLNVLLLADHRKHGNVLKKQHLKPINLPAKLPRDVKLAFLSVLSARTTRTEAAKSKRARQTSRSESASAGLDQRVVSRIFVFAGPALLRRVYVQTTNHYWEPYDEW
ncbi:hypothetical protein PF011_g11329 [Phytophthora fragariae]|uniref:Uncharacterized protein n=1 Tax=Phytophthora fragariae TaxID=53985 RepID=A0A6A3KI27_9STRA|nr:hypothetical protein PF011_g11329 [Phytophthora fragariae]